MHMTEKRKNNPTVWRLSLSRRILRFELSGENRQSDSFEVPAPVPHLVGAMR